MPLGNLDPFALYRQPKVKMLMNKLIFIVVGIFILWNLAAIALHHGFTNIWSYINSGDFYTLIIVLILAWVGHTMLNGKFQPPAEMQQAVQARKQQKIMQRGEYVPPQSQQPIQRKQRIPIKIQTDYCNLCGKEIDVANLRDFKDNNGNIIYVCNKCFSRVIL